ncbi:hypothetical protein GJ496_001758 [Pomphorhynchus laevis]|nr:hypothetical protein GJ496_001758 [Pomphorhynchus laevis]
MCYRKAVCVHSAEEHTSISCPTIFTRKCENSGKLHKAYDHRCSAFIAYTVSIQINAELKHHSNTGTVIIKSSNSALSSANATKNYNNLDSSNTQDSSIEKLEQRIRDQQALIERSIITLDKLTVPLSSIIPSQQTKQSTILDM